MAFLLKICLELQTKKKTKHKCFAFFNINDLVCGVKFIISQLFAIHSVIFSHLKAVSLFNFFSKDRSEIRRIQVYAVVIYKSLRRNLSIFALWVVFIVLKMNELLQCFDFIFNVFKNVFTKVY
ncbi:MAG: hypothetical protein K0R77_242 [Chryseobacterium sp.]|jgi:hypothetical protein|uniref:hypothetical protein n=1 Tax=Chryseobacterium sp. TaxID=1871047 RepID=UPI00260E0614|nr:hypothetical protein [Chryseobacterium sp.]MDF2550967.1 hypothetical protein [Chryseobacterium sp.]